MTTVSRPVLRYHGGKWRLAPWILSHFPPHRIYTEAYGGAASVLLRKSRSYAEVYNDLDGEIVNLFRVLRNPAQARELIRVCKLTPYAREEYDLSWIQADDPIEQARRTLLRFCAAYATGAQKDYRTGFRANVTRAYTTPAHDWSNVESILTPVVDRLRGVVIESVPALELLQRYDTTQTLHYVDPPYVLATRDSRCAGVTYSHEMSDEDHVELASVLHTLIGMVVISGYRCDLYDQLYAGWQRVDKSARADGNAPRVESIWISPNAIQQPSLFQEQMQP